VCAGKVQQARASELTPAVARWLAGGGGVSLVTATVRHNAGHRLDEVWGGVLGGWHGMTTGRGWFGGTTRKGESYDGNRGRYGVLGWMRTVECTTGRNGWHVHAHALLFTASPLSASQSDDLAADLFPRWRDAVAREGLSAVEFDPRTGKRVGVDVTTFGTGQADAAAASIYTNKTTYSAADWREAGAASREALLSAYKRAYAGNRTPFAVLASIVTAEAEGLTESRLYDRDRARWSEWERVAPGRRQTAWSKGCRDMLGMTVEAPSDEELATDDSLGGQTVCTFLAPSWRSFSADYRRPTTLLDAAEAEGPTAAREYARDYLTWNEDKRQARALSAPLCSCDHKALGYRAHLPACSRAVWRDAERLRDLPVPRVRFTPDPEPFALVVDEETGEVTSGPADVGHWRAISGVPPLVWHGPLGAGPEYGRLYGWAEHLDPEPAYDLPDDLAPVTVGVARYTAGGKPVDLASLARSYGLAS
jgi:hypothetical protein